MSPDENYRLARSEKANRKVVVANTPSLLTVETTSICNLRCVMCPQAIGAVDRPKHLPVAIMDSVAEPLSVASAVQLHGIGEPLTSPSFWRALEGDFLHPECDVSFNTNLTIFNERRIQRLMSVSGRLMINVSLDAATTPTYRRIRGFDLDEVINNIKRLISARGPRSHPMVYMNMTMMRENVEEVVQFVELAHELKADGVYLWHLNRTPDEDMARYETTKDDGWHFDYAAQGLWNFPELSNQWVQAAAQRGEELNIPVYLDQNKVLFYETPAEASAPPASAADALVVEDQISVKDCGYPWEWAVISSDGSVRPCCYAAHEVGNLNQAGFASIWNGEVMQALRKDILADRVNAVCAGAACKYVQLTPPPAETRRDSAPLSVWRRFFGIKQKA